MAPIRCFDQTAVWHSDAARGPSTPSFNDLVGAGEQRRRHLKTERLRGFQVDDQLELCRRLHRQVGWLLSLEDAIHVSRRAAVLVDHIRAVGYQAARGNEDPQRIDGWQPTL